jgi:hypothetical protein
MVTAAAVIALTVAATTGMAQAQTFTTSKPLSGTLDYSPRHPTVGSVTVAGAVRVAVPPTPNNSPDLIRVNTELINVEVTGSGIRCAAREPQTFLIPEGTTAFTGTYRLIPAGGGPDAPPNPAPTDQCRLLTLGISYVLQIDQAGTVQDITATPVYSDVNLTD